jgi:hypothetical protein
MAIVGAGLVTAVEEEGALIGVVADLLVVSADPDRSTKQTAQRFGR